MESLMKTSKLRRRRWTRGAATVEYSFLLLAFCVPVLIATIAAGHSLVKGYTKMRNVVLAKGP